MKNIFTKITTTAAVGVALSAAITYTAPKADATTLDLLWKGEVTGYSLKGVLSFDETQITPSSIVTKNTPEFNLDFSIFDPAKNLLATYTANQNTYSGLNFNFDTSTNQVLQSQVFSDPNGFDLGIFPPVTANKDFSFYTSSGSSSVVAGTIRLCSGDRECSVDKPVGQGGILDQGGVLVATAVPEPSMMAGLALVNAVGIYIRRRRQQAAK